LSDRVGPSVIDASAIVPLVAKESCSALARRWFSAAQDHLASSVTIDLFDAECANAVWKRVRWSRWSKEDAELALDRVLALPFPRMAFGEIAGEALRVAVRFEITVYDACYVALAATTSLPLVTADRRMARAARSAGCTVLCLTEDATSP
jgi:predicted nucleic acid-binding protein